MTILGVLIGVLILAAAILAASSLLNVALRGHE